MDETLWHKCNDPFIPRRTIDGGWTESISQTWRRKRNGRWEYKQDKLTDAERLDELERRQW